MRVPVLLLAVVVTTPFAVPLAARADDAPAAKPTREQLLGALPGKRLSYVSHSGRTVQWVSNADGTATLNISPSLGSKHASGASAPGRWSVDENGKYCMDEDWPTDHGGPNHWCRNVTLDGDGAPVLESRE